MFKVTLNPHTAEEVIDLRGLTPGDLVVSLEMTDVGKVYVCTGQTSVNTLLQQLGKRQSYVTSTHKFRHLRPNETVTITRTH